MKALIFDAGPVITITMNNLLWVLEDLKKKYRGKFLLAEGVRYELVEKPLKTKKFKFEALQTLHYIDKGVLDVVKDRKVESLTKKLLDIANTIYFAHNRPLQIVHLGEMAALALLIERKGDALVVDERTTRLLIENSNRLHTILGKKLHTKIDIDKEKLHQFQEMTKGVKVIRSVEIITIAYELGLLDKFLRSTKESKQELLDALLWGLKIDGCAVSPRDIERIKKIERG